MRTEIIPFEPDAVSTAEGKSRRYLCRISNESFHKGPFLKFYYKTKFGMEIIINGQYKEIPEQFSVQHLLSSLFPGPPVKGVAVAINQSVVPGSEWATRLLQSHDQVMLIKATQGG